MCGELPRGGWEWVKSLWVRIKGQANTGDTALGVGYRSPGHERKLVRPGVCQANHSICLSVTKTDQWGTRIAMVQSVMEVIPSRYCWTLKCLSILLGSFCALWSSRPDPNSVKLKSSTPPNVSFAIFIVKVHRAEQMLCMSKQDGVCLIHIAFFLLHSCKISYFALLLVYLSNFSWLHSEMDYKEGLPQW